MATAALNGIDIYFEVRGSGPRLLVFNGSGASIAGAGMLIEALAASFEVLVHDQRCLDRMAISSVCMRLSYTSDGWVAPKHAMAQFWGAHQRFFKTLCMSLKLDAVVRIAKEALAAKKAVVIGLQKTGQASLDAAMKDSDVTNDLVASSEIILKRMRKKLFPLPSRARAADPSRTQRLQKNKQKKHLKFHY
jgi:hypothetical protein